LTCSEIVRVGGIEGRQSDVLWGSAIILPNPLRVKNYLIG